MNLLSDVNKMASEVYLLLIEDLLFLGECLHPELDVPQHVDGADASLVLANNLDK